MSLVVLECSLMGNLEREFPTPDVCFGSVSTAAAFARHELVDGPANEEAVCRKLERAFARFGVPRVLKHDGGSIFHGRRIRALLDKHQVTELTGPRQ